MELSENHLNTNTLKTKAPSSSRAPQNGSKMQAKQLEHYLARTALGDQEAFKLLYETCGGRLNGVAFRILNNVDAANEVLQEAFVQIWHNAKDYRSGKAEPLTWMSSIVRYRALDRIRAESRRIEGQPLETELSIFEAIEDGSRQGVFCDTNQQLETCIEQLEHSQQRSILLAYYYGYSREEIAQQLSSPINTIKSWLRRGLRRLQLCLDN